MKHACACVSVAAVGLVLLTASPVLRAQGDEKSHWGMEGGFGVAYIPASLPDAVQDRYSASLDGNTYNFGLVHFHASGAPSYSLQFCHMMLEGNAAALGGVDASYQGSGSALGFLATKYVNFVARRRFSIGMGFGAGVGPQLKYNYTRSVTIQGKSFSEQKAFTLEELPVTPMFEIQFRGDIRISRNLSVGPWAAIRNGIPFFGGVVRVHFLN